MPRIHSAHHTRSVGCSITIIASMNSSSSKRKCLDFDIRVVIVSTAFAPSTHASIVCLRTVGGGFSILTRGISPSSFSAIKRHETTLSGGDSRGWMCASSSFMRWRTSATVILAFLRCFFSFGPSGLSPNPASNSCSSTVSSFPYSGSTSVWASTTLPILTFFSCFPAGWSHWIFPDAVCL